MITGSVKAFINLSDCDDFEVVSIMVEEIGS